MFMGGAKESINTLCWRWTLLEAQIKGGGVWTCCRFCLVLKGPLFPIYSAHSVHLILFGPFVQVQSELLLLQL